jgi:hypothetical protein
MARVIRLDHSRHIRRAADGEAACVLQCWKLTTLLKAASPVDLPADFALVGK